MKNITFTLLLILVPLTYQLYHCVNSYKTCAPNSPKVANCLYGYDDECLVCEENYSLSNDRTSCINVPNCAAFDSQKKCTQCNYYYNFDKDKNCVVDPCQNYASDGKCSYCYPGYYINNNGACQRISIPYCLSVSYSDEKVCTSCTYGTKLDTNGKCVVYSKIEGCEDYNQDGTCKECMDGLYKSSGNGCAFQNACGVFPAVEVCELCEDGYYVDNYSDQCIGYDGSHEKLSKNIGNNINVGFGLLSLLINLIF